MKMNSKFLFSARYVILASALAWFTTFACIPPCPPQEPVELPGFLLGSSQGGINEIPLKAEIGVDWMRAQLNWRQVEPEILNRELTVEDVDADPDAVPFFIATHDWTAFDSLLAEMKAYGLQAFAVLGLGHKGALPYFQGARVTPDLLGRENYLGHIYLYARATVERYNGDGEYDAPGELTIKYWQLENELNQAFLAALWGWRTPGFEEALGSAWQSWQFLTDLLHTLSRAVKTEDPDAMTAVNFHTDIPAGINQGFLLPSWPEAIRRWAGYIDIVGMTAFPNYYDPDPVRGEVLGERVIEAMEMGCHRPVVILETGYTTGPEERGYSEAGQAVYIQEAYESALNAGAQGFFLFGIKTSDSHNVEITPEDVENLEHLTGLFEQGNFLPLLSFALQNFDYIKNHFVHVLWSIESYWGLIRPDGTHKPGWVVYHDIADQAGVPF